MLADELRAAQRRLDEANYQEDIAYAMLRRARAEREKVVADVLAIQQKMIDAWGIV